MSILWRPAMAIDDGLIDHDHQLLISIINDFCELKPTVDGISELLRTLARLHHYANTHFAREEQLQTFAAFPFNKDHREEHQRLARRLNMISQRVAAFDQQHAFRDNDPNTDIIVVEDADVRCHLDVHNEISALLRSWVIQHIVKNDRPMRPYVDAMKSQAARMPSLWAVKPAVLMPNMDTPQAARQAVRSANGWMHAGFRNEHGEPQDQPVKPTENEIAQEHPAVVQMRKEAKRLGMAAEFDTQCTDFSSSALAQVLRMMSSPQSGTPQRFEFTPSNERPYLRQMAVFERIPDTRSVYRYRAKYVGTKFARIFGDIANRDLETAVLPYKYERWKMLVDGVLAFNAPLRVVSVV